MPDQVTTIIPNVESIASDTVSKTERTPIKEKAPSLIPVPTTPQETTNKSMGVSTKTSAPAVSKVVNKTKEPEILHPVDPEADTLTTIADKEEEEFIKEVIKEHQNGSK